MRPPGSNYKNYCSSKLLMSYDVLPTCEEGLGVEKACYPDEDAREGAPQAPCCSLTQAGEKQCTQTTKANKKKDQGHATRVVVVGGDSCSHRNRIKIRAFFSQRWASSQRLGVAGVLGSQRSTNLCLGRTELLIKAGKWFQTHAALQVWGLDSDRWGTGSARRFQNQPLSLCSNANTADGFYKLLRVSSSSESSELDRMFAFYL